MGYERHLLDLLQPLGVYSFKDGTFSKAMIAALGSELDVAENWLLHCEREAVLETAENEGLTLRAELFAARPEGDSYELRGLIRGLSCIADDSFTPEAINRSVAGLGAVIVEMGGGKLTVRFPKIVGMPANFTVVKRIIEDILPCHMAVSYYFNYLTWQELHGYNLTWGQTGSMTWPEFMGYRKGEII